MLTRQLPCGSLMCWPGSHYRSPWQFGRDAIPWNSLLAKNLGKPGKGDFSSSNVGRGSVSWWPGKISLRMSLQKVKGAEEKGNCVISVHLTCSAEGAANILGRLLNSSWKHQSVCLVWQMQLVSNSTKCLEGVRHFQLKLNSMMSVADEIRVGVDFWDYLLQFVLWPKNKLRTQSTTNIRK